MIASNLLAAIIAIESLSLDLSLLVQAVKLLCWHLKAMS
jgi:hypothetical protein